jgi:hypothetical protein
MGALASICRSPLTRFYLGGTDVERDTGAGRAGGAECAGGAERAGALVRELEPCCVAPAPRENVPVGALALTPVCIGVLRTL